MPRNTTPLAHSAKSTTSLTMSLTVLTLCLGLTLNACGDDASDDDGVTPSNEANNTPNNDPNNTPNNDPNNTPNNDPNNTPNNAPNNTPNNDPNNTPNNAPNNTPNNTAPDPYASVDGLTNRALIDGLRALVEDHNALTYGEARDVMYGIRARIDVIDGVIECMYTGRTTEPDRTRTPGGFNTEHSWPRSEGADMEPALSDLHHIFPTTGDSNLARGTLSYGDTACSGRSCDFSDGGSQSGARQGGGGDAFEVRSARRGDIARAHFYFAVRYRRSIDPREEEALRRWHAQDPPDEHELNRHEQVARFQRNRNPFIDRPDFVDLIADF